MERKEAIEVIKKNWPDSSFTMLREALETLVPELKESEDERIRKWLIHYFKEVCDNVSEKEKKGVLAWLEKQREQKPAEEIEPTPIFRIGDILKRKGKDYTFRVDRIQGGYYHCDHNHGAFFPIEEQGNWELVEQKPAEWSEENEKMFEHIIAKATLHFSSINYLDEEEINFLKSLRPQNAWKPTEEQMDALDYYANSLCTYCDRQDDLRSLFNVLKKLTE